MRESGKYEHCSHGMYKVSAGDRPTRALKNNVLEC